MFLLTRLISSRVTVTVCFKIPSYQFLRKDRTMTMSDDIF